nr:hypothetical protein [Candidatus Sigynarchaeota archaeon]
MTAYTPTYEIKGFTWTFPAASNVSFNLSTVWAAGCSRADLYISAEDLAGNENWEQCLYRLIYLDDARIIQPIGKAATGEDMLYGDLFEGIVVDSFGIPRVNEAVEVYVNSKFFGKTMTNSNGYFSLTLASIDSFSPELQYLAECSPSGFHRQFSMLPGTDILDAMSNIHYTRDIAILEKDFTAIGTHTLYRQSKFSISLSKSLERIANLTSYEGIQIDLLIPDVASTLWQCTTFDSITLTFVDEDLHEFPWTLDRQALLTYFDPAKHPEAQAVLINGKNLRRVRINIPFQVLAMMNLENVPFNISTLQELKISGNDSAVWPGTITPGALPIQRIGICGARLIDQLPGNGSATRPVNVQMVAGSSRAALELTFNYIWVSLPCNSTCFNRTLNFDTGLDDWFMTSTQLNTTAYPLRLDSGNGTATIENGSVRLSSALNQDTRITWIPESSGHLIPSRVGAMIKIDTNVTNNSLIMDGFNFMRQEAEADLPSTIAYLTLSDSLGPAIEVGFHKVYDDLVIYGWHRGGEADSLTGWEDGWPIPLVGGSWYNFSIEIWDWSQGIFQVIVNGSTTLIPGMFESGDLLTGGLTSIALGIAASGSFNGTTSAWFDDVMVTWPGANLDAVSIAPIDVVFDSSARILASTYDFSTGTADRDQWNGINAEFGVNAGRGVRIQPEGRIQTMASYTPQGVCTSKVFDPPATLNMNESINVTVIIEMVDAGDITATGGGSLLCDVTLPIGMHELVSSITRVPSGYNCEAYVDENMVWSYLYPAMSLYNTYGICSHDAIAVVHAVTFSWRWCGEPVAQYGDLYTIAATRIQADPGYGTRYHDTFNLVNPSNNYETTRPGWTVTGPYNSMKVQGGALQISGPLHYGSSSGDIIVTSPAFDMGVQEAGTVVIDLECYGVNTPGIYNAAFNITGLTISDVSAFWLGITGSSAGWHFKWPGGEESVTRGNTTRGLLVIDFNSTCWNVQFDGATIVQSLSRLNSGVLEHVAFTAGNHTAGSIKLHDLEVNPPYIAPVGDLKTYPISCLPWQYLVLEGLNATTESYDPIGISISDITGQACSFKMLGTVDYTYPQCRLQYQGSILLPSVTASMIENLTIAKEQPAVDLMMDEEWIPPVATINDTFWTGSFTSWEPWNTTTIPAQDSAKAQATVATTAPSCYNSIRSLLPSLFIKTVQWKVFNYSTWEYDYFDATSTATRNFTKAYPEIISFSMAYQDAINLTITIKNGSQDAIVLRFAYIPCNHDNWTTWDDNVTIQGIPVCSAKALRSLGTGKPRLIEFSEINWTSHSFDLRIDGVTMARNLSLANNTTSMDAIHIESVGNTALGVYFDNFYVGEDPDKKPKDSVLHVDYETGAMMSGYICDDDGEGFLGLPTSLQNITLDRYNLIINGWQPYNVTVNASQSAIIQIWNASSSTWFNWLVMPIGIGGLYMQFINTTHPTDVSYLPPGIYRARLDAGEGDPRYLTIQASFYIVVDQANTKITITPGTSSSRSRVDISNYYASREYTQSTFTAGAGQPWTFLDLSRTYGDPATFSFTITDASGLMPLAGVPVWLAIGIVPQTADEQRSQEYYWDAMPSFLALQTQTGEVPLGLNTYYEQEKTGRSIYYPFYNASSLAWERWGPSIYQYDYSDQAGKVEWTISDSALREIVGDITRVLKQSVFSLASIKLAVRCWYDPDFTWSDAQLPLVEDGRYVSFVNASGVDNYVDGDEINDLQNQGVYIDPYFDSCYAEGYMSIEAEDLALIASAMELTPVDDRMYLNFMAVEADDQGNGQLTPEWQEDCIGSHADLETNPVSITAEIWDETNTNPVVQSQYLVAETDGDGVVSIEVSPATIGEEGMNKLWPGFYTGHAYAEPSMYYKAANTTFKIVIKGSNGMNMSAPTIVYDLLAMADSRAIVYRDSLAAGSLPVLESTAPILSGTILARNTTNLMPGNWSANPDIEEPGYDGVEVTILVNNVSSAYHAFDMPSNATLDQAWNFSIPLDTWAGSNVSIDICVESLNNATSKEILITGLRISDTGSADRSDADWWDLLSEIPTGAVENTTKTYNANTGDVNGSFIVHDPSGTNTTINTFDMNMTLYGAARSNTTDVVNNASVPAISILHLDWAEDAPASTVFSLPGLLVPCRGKKLDHVHYDGILPSEQLFSGWQFPQSTVDESVRWSNVTIGGNQVPGLYIKPSASETVVVEYENLYIPYRAGMAGSIALAPAPAGSTIRVTLGFENLIDPTNCWSWNTTLATSVNGTIMNFTITEAMMASIAERNCHVQVNVSLVNGSASDARVHLLGLRIEGWEDLILVSSGMPAPLRARVFSNTMLYYYTYDAITNLGVNEHPGTIDDMRVELSGNITDWLNVRNYSIPFDQETYDWKNWSQFKDLFQEDTGGNWKTFYELDPANNNSAFLWFKFDEVQKNVTEPVVVSGKIKIFDGSNTDPIDNKTRKLSILVQPYHHVAYQYYWAMNGSSSINTTLPDPITLDNNSTDGLENVIQVAYRRPVSVKDIAFTDWGALVEVLPPVLSDNSTNPALANVSSITSWLNVTGCPDDITDQPEWWDEVCTAPTWRWLNWTNATASMGGLLEQGADGIGSLISYDSYIGSRAMILHTNPSRPALAAMMDVPEAPVGAEWDEYSYIGYDVVTLNASAISHLSVLLKVIDAYGDPRIVNLTTTFPRNETYLRRRESLANLIGTGERVVNVAFVVIPKDLFGPQKNYSVGILGLYFEHEDSMAVLRAGITTPGNVNVTEDVVLPITPFTWPLFDVFTWRDNTTLVGTLRSLEIISGQDVLIDVQHMAVAVANETSWNIVDTLYEHVFDWQARNYELVAFQLATPYARPPTMLWTATGTVNATAYAPWSRLDSFDLDFSGTIDLSIQRQDIRGDANYTDGVEDATSIDANGDGAFETTIIDTWYSDITTVEGYAVNSTSLVKRVLSDANGNGVFESTSMDVVCVNSQIVNSTRVVSWNQVTKEWSITTWDFAGARPLFYYQDTKDYNEDGSDDWSLAAQDAWDDRSPAGLPTYETKVETVRVPMYNETSQSWYRNETITSTCDISWKNHTFRLLDVDGYTNITCDVYVLDGVDVVIDPRISIPDECRIGVNGCIYFVDMDNNLTNGIEIGFVLTNITKQKPIPEAIGYFQNLDRDYAMNTSREVYLGDSFSDRFVPTYWLSNTSATGFAYITGKAYNEGWTQYWNSHDVPFWVGMIMDTAEMITLMVLSSVITSWGMAFAVAAASTGIGAAIAAITLAVVFFLNLFLNLCYQEYRKKPIMKLLFERNPEYATNAIGDADKTSGEDLGVMAGGTSYKWKGIQAAGTPIYPNATAANNSRWIWLKLPDLFNQATVQGTTTEGYIEDQGLWSNASIIARHEMFDYFFATVYPTQMNNVSTATGGLLNNTVAVIDHDCIIGFMLAGPDSIPSFNASHPLTPVIEYETAAYAAMYNAYVATGREGGTAKFYDILIQLVQLVIATLATKAIMTRVPVYRGIRQTGVRYWAVEPWGSATEVVKDVVQEALEELVYENLVSTGSKWLFRLAGFQGDDVIFENFMGLPGLTFTVDYLCEQLGEAVVDMFGVFKKHIMEQYESWQTNRMLQETMTPDQYQQYQESSLESRRLIADAMRAAQANDADAFTDVYDRMTYSEIATLAEMATTARGAIKGRLSGWIIAKMMAEIGLTEHLFAPGGRIQITMVSAAGYNVLANPNTFTNPRHVDANLGSMVCGLVAIIQANPTLTMYEIGLLPATLALFGIAPGTARVDFAVRRQGGDWTNYENTHAMTGEQFLAAASGGTIMLTDAQNFGPENNLPQDAFKEILDAISNNDEAGTVQACVKAIESNPGCYDQVMRLLADRGFLQTHPGYESVFSRANEIATELGLAFGIDAAPLHLLENVMLDAFAGNIPAADELMGNINAAFQNLMDGPDNAIRVLNAMGMAGRMFDLAEQANRILPAEVFQGQPYTTEEYVSLWDGVTLNNFLDYIENPEIRDQMIETLLDDLSDLSYGAWLHNLDIGAISEALLMDSNGIEEMFTAGSGENKEGRMYEYISHEVPSVPAEVPSPIGTAPENGIELLWTIDHHGTCAEAYIWVSIYRMLMNPALYGQEFHVMMETTLDTCANDYLIAMQVKELVWQQNHIELIIYMSSPYQGTNYDEGIDWRHSLVLGYNDFPDFSEVTHSYFNANSLSALQLDINLILNRCNLGRWSTVIAGVFDTHFDNLNHVVFNTQLLGQYLQSYHE